MNETVKVDRQLLGFVIETLKTIDVRGFESMDALVGCVITLTQMMNTPVIKTETKEEAKYGR